MTELLPFLKSLVSIGGLSGHEKPIRQLIEAAWKPYTDELQVSRLGSLHGWKCGNAREPRPAILLAAHMDAIGLMVTEVQDGFLRICEIGGVDGRVLPGQLVTVHGREDLPGVVVQPPPHLLPPEVREGPLPIKYLMVDTGLQARQVKQLVRTGDLISFAQEPLELQGEYLVGHSLDNRASIAALTHCLELLQGRTHAWDVWAVATVQEEVTFGGARTSAFELRPQAAIAVDTTWGKSPGSPDHKTFPLGKGPTLGWGPSIHPRLYKAFKSLAERLEIPHSVEVMPRHSSTDADALQVVAEGLPTLVVCIPIRYMHTPVEMVAVKDIARTGHLLAEFVSSLAIDFLDRIGFDE